MDTTIDEISPEITEELRRLDREGFTKDQIAEIAELDVSQIEQLVGRAQTALEKAIQRCAELRKAASPILRELMDLHCRNGWSTDKYYFFLPENADFQGGGRNKTYKLSLETGFLWEGQDGKNFFPMVTGRYFDIIDLWKRLPAVDSVTAACDRLEADIRYITTECYDAKLKRQGKQAKQNAKAKAELYLQIRRNLAEMLSDGEYCEACPRDIWKTYAAVHGQPLSSYKFKAMLEEFEDEGSDLWIKVERVKLRNAAHRNIFRITKTQVTQATVVERETERAQAELAERKRQTEIYNQARQAELERRNEEITRLEAEQQSLIETMELLTGLKWNSSNFDIEDGTEAMSLYHRFGKLTHQIEKLGAKP